MTGQAYPDGVDFSWFAVDRDGHVGSFITAGSGSIPSLLLDADRMPAEDLEEWFFQRLPPVCSASVLVDVPSPDSLLALAERGLFVHDWGWDVGKYKHVAIPTEPITIEALPREVAAQLEGLILTHVSFAERASVDISAHLPCRRGHD